ncbi:hypothetical protein Aspvir_004325 [Aspergillus viridinutans]|uniref:Uncharacterized protein n=1 Tax=Aspergillus viridinutans TaxID=75553 RepID=A0A9P3BTH5_ASPVI|nr:uncharacterized protein Aspvir_004325 [Aspergillus viridinutans]GIK00303.1 hypothetical protein Aspvir_004325 [Aspergillus viridinutans]
MTDPMELISRPDSQFDHEENLKSQNQEKQPKQEQLENGKQEHAAPVPTPKPHNPLPNTFTISGEYGDDNTNPIISSLLVVLHSILTFLDTYILPPHLRAAIFETALAHPLLTTFLLCQFVCSCIPVTIFLIGAVVAGGIAVVVFSCFALLVLGPVLVATTVAGLFLWGWGWATFVVGRWLLRRYLSEDGDGEKNREREGANGFIKYDAEKAKEESA